MTPKKEIEFLRGWVEYLLLTNKNLISKNERLIIKKGHILNSEEEAALIVSDLLKAPMV